MGLHGDVDDASATLSAPWPHPHLDTRRDIAAAAITARTRRRISPAWSEPPSPGAPLSGQASDVPDVLAPNLRCVLRSIRPCLLRTAGGRRGEVAGQGSRALDAQ